MTGQRDGVARGVVDNAPYQSTLAWRIADHHTSLSRARVALAGEDQPQSLRALATHGTEEPAIALLDCWAVVADIVSFYTERIANEGFLRTATELRSVRELARTLGHELHPGVAAYVDLAFTVDDGVTTEVTVGRGTPVQSIPRPEQLPQTFETSEELRARASWNQIASAPRKRQTVLPGRDSTVWLEGVGLGIGGGQPILVRDRNYAGVWLVVLAEENPEGVGEWTRIRIAPFAGPPPATFSEDAEFSAFDARSFVFGWNAPDRQLFNLPGQPAQNQWPGFEQFLHDGCLELDGEHPDIPPQSWVVVVGSRSESPGSLESGEQRALAAQVLGCALGNAARYTLSGLITKLTFDTATTPLLAGQFDRRGTVIHHGSRVLTTRWMPRSEPESSADRRLVLERTDPVLPVGRRIVISGNDPRGMPITATATVLSCAVDPDGQMTVDVDRLPDCDPRTVLVLANVVAATHGETVSEVLGGGDGRFAFARFPTRRAPLTYVRAPTATGVRTSLEIRVDGVTWTEVESLAELDDDDRVFTVRRSDDGGVTVQFGDGSHGARVPTGIDNVAAEYRVGIGAQGSAEAGQISMLVRRPSGIRQAVNPAPSADWAEPETLETARRNAPARVRTLDRAVSVKDHEDFAAAFAGVDAATAAAVWNGRQDILTISLVGAGGEDVSTGLLDDLDIALSSVREQVMPLLLIAAEQVSFQIEIDVRYDPAHLQAAVDDAVRRTLRETFGAGRWPVATQVTAARVLVTVLSVPGVEAAAMPALRHRRTDDSTIRLDAWPARRGLRSILAAQALRLADDSDAITIRPMS